MGVLSWAKKPILGLMDFPGEMNERSCLQNLGDMGTYCHVCSPRLNNLGHVRLLLLQSHNVISRVTCYMLHPVFIHLLCLEKWRLLLFQVPRKKREIEGWSLLGFPLFNPVLFPKFPMVFTVLFPLIFWKLSHAFPKCQIISILQSFKFNNVFRICEATS